MEDNYKIQTLVETKAYSELTDAEKALVLSEITAEEYTARHRVIQSTRALLHQGIANVQPPALTKAAALAYLESKKQNTGLLQYRIPVYIPMAATLLLLLTLAFGYNTMEERIIVANTKPVKTEYIYRTDTVTIEKEVPTYINVPVVKYVAMANTKQPTTTANTNAPAETPVSPYGITFHKEQVEEQLKNIGQPSTGQEELNRFLVMAR